MIPGLEVFLRDYPVTGRVGVVTNSTGCDRQGRHIVDLLQRCRGIRLAAILTPEHGFGADAPDGESVADSLHPELRVPIISLYGAQRSPAQELLAEFDAVLYDIQDVGVRFYTYISTLRNVLEATALAGKPLHILDRPDLLGGQQLEGPMLAPEFASFVGHLPVPIRYGMTAGELARWWNSRLPKPAELHVWPCEGWVRGQAFADLGIPWVQPSPSMCHPSTVTFYPGTCLFEGTNVSEGRGSELPFQMLGAPWVVPERWLECLAPLLPSSVTASVCGFIPTFSKFAGEYCHGLRLTTRETLIDDAVSLGVSLLWSLQQTHPEFLAFPGRPNLPHPFLDYLAGSAELRDGLQRGVTRADLQPFLKRGLEAFDEERRQFLIYQPPTPTLSPKTGTPCASTLLAPKRSKEEALYWQTH